MPSVRVINSETKCENTFEKLKNDLRYDKEKNLIQNPTPLNSGEPSSWPRIPEIFIEICHYLSPEDLLSLSRTCREFRRNLCHPKNQITQTVDGFSFSCSFFFFFCPVLIVNVSFNALDLDDFPAQIYAIFATSQRN